MEIINENKPPVSRNASTAARNIYLGVVLILIGVVWMLSNFGLVGDGFFYFFFSWQMMLIFFGGLFLARRWWIAGGITVALGVIFALTDFFGICLPVSQVLLPSVVIAVGIVFLWQRER